MAVVSVYDDAYVRSMPKVPMWNMCVRALGDINY